jgi:hypothetical protein
MSIKGQDEQGVATAHLHLFNQGNRTLPARIWRIS